jgi:hypothetical protein
VRRRPKYTGKAIDGPAKGQTLSSNMKKMKVRGALSEGGFSAVYYDWLPTSDGGVWFSGVDQDGGAGEDIGESH